MKIQDPPPKSPPSPPVKDGYENLFVKGAGDSSLFIAGEQTVNGAIQMDSDPDAEMDIDITDPRYQRCLETARALKKQYPLTELDPQRNRAAFIERERIIVAKLTEKIHEEYGSYNELTKARYTGLINSTKAFITGSYGERSEAELASVHHDIYRMHGLRNDGTLPEPNDPPITRPKLSEFKKDEFVCRHYTPVTSALLTEAGAANAQVLGEIMRGTKIGTFTTASSNPSGHAWIVSRKTGNIIEGTAKGVGAYHETANQLSFEEILAGKSALTITPHFGHAAYTAYNTGATGSADSNALIQKRLELIAQKKFDALPSNITGGDLRYEPRYKTDPSYKAGVDKKYAAHLAAAGTHDVQTVAALPSASSVKPLVLGLGALLGAGVSALTGMGWIASIVTLAISTAAGWLAAPAIENALDSRKLDPVPQKTGEGDPKKLVTALPVHLDHGKKEEELSTYTITDGALAHANHFIQKMDKTSPAETPMPVGTHANTGLPFIKQNEIKLG